MQLINIALIVPDQKGLAFPEDKNVSVAIYKPSKSAHESFTFLRQRRIPVSWSRLTLDA